MLLICSAFLGIIEFHAFGFHFSVQFAIDLPLATRFGNWPDSVCADVVSNTSQGDIILAATFRRLTADLLAVEFTLSD